MTKQTTVNQFLRSTNPLEVLDRIATAVENLAGSIRILTAEIPEIHRSLDSVGMAVEQGFDGLLERYQND